MRTGYQFTFVFLIAMIISGNMLNAQSENWEYQHPLPSIENLWGVSFADANYGTAVGNVGTIIGTTDGGENWVAQQSGVTTHLYGVSFSNADDGIAVGANGIILSTTDGGNNWIQKTSGTTNTLRAVFFTEELYGTAVGDGGIILRTIDGGNSWNVQASGTTNPLYSVAFDDIHVGFAVGDGGKILLTTDGGTNWVSKNSGTANALRGVGFRERNSLVVVGDGVILKTTNDGNTWTRSITNYSQTGVSFSDADNGIITVAMNNLMFRTADGGDNWIQQEIPTDRLLYGVSFANANNGIAVGFYGIIIRTTDGGSSWTKEQKGFPYDGLSSVAFADVNNGTAVGSNNNVFRTTDGGETWVKQYVGSNEGTYTSICFSDENNGYFTGNGGTYKTTNGGEDWIARSGFAYSQDVTSPAPGYYTVVTIYGHIFTTKDDGATWYQHLYATTNFLNAVHFSDTLNGWVAGYQGTIMRTTDGGISWANQVSGVTQWLYDISFVDADHGWIVGTNGTILKTTNGGNTWDSLTTGINGENFSLSGVSFIDVNNGIAVGVGTVYAPSVILRTTDGGDSWLVEKFPPESNCYFGDVSLVDVNHGWVVGAFSIILRTTNGGGIPVELSSFTASANLNNVLLNWTTATETNNRGFDIQRLQNYKNTGLQDPSAGQAGWETIGYVPGYGTTTESQSYSFTDADISEGKYLYRLKQIDYDGTFEYSNEVEMNVSLPVEFTLNQNYPNPFNPTTKISFSLASDSKVTLKIYDVLGQLVTTLLNKDITAGYQEINFNAANFNSGVYFYTLEAKSKDGENFISTKKMILIK